MKKNIVSAVVLLVMIPFLSGCGFKSMEKLIRKTMTIDDVVVEKEQLDKVDNPAKKYMITNDLGQRLIELDSVVVKDIIPSTDIDYEFCVVAQVQHEKGLIVFYIYSRDLGTIAKIEKGKTKIWALGDFRRFFPLLDNSYVKIDVTDADISIVE